MLRSRVPPVSKTAHNSWEKVDNGSEDDALLGGDADEAAPRFPTAPTGATTSTDESPEAYLNSADMAPRNVQWIYLAVASGGCAAFNGVFAKLTTTELTSTFAQAIARGLGLEPENKLVEYGIRAVFFALNLVFNGVMWGLFTTALARGTSTTQVSIINTSANFMLTALLGFMIFSEALPPLFWLGAAFLVAGNVIIGRRDEGFKDGVVSLDTERPERQSARREEGEADEEVDLLGDAIELDDELKRGEEVDNPVR
ncbi:MAG: hypothetical protein M1833_000868 [Piccolia ochrophora]|nr:MAG: hypothetical protein M1833_000868 [Piccolia ochrophora]